MNLEKLYKMQDELDQHILENARKRNIEMSKAELLDKTILALLVEVGELANATRCFKHWSTKGPESKERLLDELADIWHFYLSIGNQIGLRLENDDSVPDEHPNNLVDCFISVYYWVNKFEDCTSSLEKRTFVAHTELGRWLAILAHKLGFTDKEVEQAYMKKHEENYRRQREGY
ncbi:dUTP diphosphatase [Tissierella sp. MSJ-40]|uniref:dUTP diphosphatase n=1 Tax=Tissierella simiarum TaxID=2841534 RepID=A0ABS6EBJ8_9FIRM|nr:dUTP diphosphatase [Tissierella simiarum]MBU5440310.1 dUTP diphosphatase [Tissierella simiarum]